MGFEYDPVKNLQHYPLAMAKYGLNPYLQPLYRIVLASSRRHLVGGMWPDGETAYHWLPTYKPIKDSRGRDKVDYWVLERWQVCKTTKAEWDRMVEPISGWLINGPYPSRGEYYHCWTFDQGVGEDNLATIIGAAERSPYRSVQDLDDFNRKEYADQDKETHRNTYDEIRDAFTAFGGRAFASSRVARGIKTIEPLKTAEECGLPIPKQIPAQRKPAGSRRTQDVRDIEVRNNLTAGRV